MFSKPVNNNNQEKKKTHSSRGWVITINNPKIPGDRYLDQWISDGAIVFGCGQLEKAPETGTQHLQMYVVTVPHPTGKNGYGIKWMKEHIHSTAYLDNRQGTHEEARDYCTLPEYKGKKKIVLAGPWTVGEWDSSQEQAKVKGGKAAGAVHKGKVEDMLKDVKNGKSDLEIMENYPHLFLTMHKAVEKARLIYSTTVPRQQPDVIVLYGTTGTGKSHKANQIMINNGGGKAFRKGNGGAFWADGYDAMRHPVVWFDEFDGSWFSYKMLLRITDKWTMDLDTKGGTVNFNPKIIVFTSSKHPKDWYSVEAVPDTSEMMRRLSGKHGAIINMTTEYKEPVNDGPDLIDEFDNIVSGDRHKVVAPQVAPVAQSVAVTKYINPNPIPVGVDDAPPTRRVVDLTTDEVLDGPTPPEEDSWGTETASQKMFFDLLDCEFCGTNVREGCDCVPSHEPSQEESGTDSIEGDGYIDEDFIALREAQRISLADRNEAKLLARQNAMTSETTPGVASTSSMPAAPRKRGAAELGFEPPPKAPASEFKKFKQVPGQSRLSVRPWQDPDEDVDDK